MFRKMISLLTAAVMMLTTLACCGALADGSVSNTLAEDKDALAAYADKFQQMTYTDVDTGLSI